jgi:hypothetical protein
VAAEAEVEAVRAAEEAVAVRAAEEVAAVQAAAVVGAVPAGEDPEAAAVRAAAGLLRSRGLRSRQAAAG